MGNTFKREIVSLEKRFPILAVEHGCIISKDADVTVGYKVVLPEIFSTTSEEYESIHSAWVKAIKVLPNYTIVNKQDWFIEENYSPNVEKENLSFLDRSFELHFNERPFLNHTCYLYITKTTKERSRQQSNFNYLCRGRIVPKEIEDKEVIQRFLESVSQFERIVNDCGFITLTQLTSDEITGTETTSGIIENYFHLNRPDVGYLEDIILNAGEMKIGDNYMCLHTISDTDDLPSLIRTDSRYERLSTDRSDCNLSYASAVGVMLNCNHVYNQYIFIDDHADNIKKFEASSKNMFSLSRYSRSNMINHEWTEEFLNEAHTEGLLSVRCHVNIISWDKDYFKLSRIKNDVGSQLALMECKPRLNTVDLPAIFWAGIPGNQADFPFEESFYTFLEHSVCLFSGETNYRNSPSHFGIKMVDRLTGKPLHVDISDLPMRKGLITNRNRFILGPSGSGKSFFTNHLVRQYWEQGSHVLMVDTGNSYLGLCQMINHRTKGKDGIYFTYTEENPIAFNPFYTEDRIFDIEKRESIKALVLTLWKNDSESPTKAEEVNLSNAVNLFIKKIREYPNMVPNFNMFYEFVQSEYREIIKEKNIKRKDFDIDNFVNVLEPYYEGGEYDYLLNSDKELDLLHKRFIVFELDNVKGAPVKAA